MKRVFCLLLFLCLLPALALAGETLSQGDRGDSVTELQERLNELGLSSGKADGIYGKQTAAAVKEAQRLLQAAGYDVEPTGQADASTLAYLNDAGSEDALRTLRTGSQGDRVSELQNRLIDLKLLNEQADGAYGAQTEQAVLTFQKRMAELGVEGLSEDGVASPSVLNLLMEDLSIYGFQAPVYFDESQPLSLTADALYAPSCLLMEASTGEVLFAYNADEPMYPASTTKIVTLLTVLRTADLEQTVTIPQSAADIPDDSSRVPVVPGEQMRMIDLLYGLMIRSGNDAANAVAELCAGSVDAFVQRMNSLAQEIGMTQTHFVNPHGYHDDAHYTTAHDLATAARLGLTDPTFCQIVTCLQYTLPATANHGALLLQNSYEIFNPESSFYIPGAAGIKSGYTRRAGFCYVGAAQRDGHMLIAVILHVPGRNRGWTDLRRLFAYGFARLGEQ